MKRFGDGFGWGIAAGFVVGLAGGLGAIVWMQSPIPVTRESFILLLWGVIPSAVLGGVAAAAVIGWLRVRKNRGRISDINSQRREHGG